jgi:hypothetical protein
MAKRTDSHRKGAIVPGEYAHVLSYNLPSSSEGLPVPSFGVNCVTERAQYDEDGKLIKLGEHAPGGHCCLRALEDVAKVTFASHGGMGKCSACGSRFVYGEVWRHEPTGEHVNIGHICGEKYGLLMDRSAFEIEAGRHRSAAAVRLTRKLKAESRAAFLAENPGLEDALKTDHYIVCDIAARFTEHCKLSEKQVALVMKLANEAANPEPEETYVPTPEGKQTFRGRVISVKDQEGYYGWTTKATVKVETPDGVWLAWGTAPAKLLDDAADNNDHELKGAEVEITATLTRSDRDEHFAFMKRPRGKVISYPKADEEAA